MIWEIAFKEFGRHKLRTLLTMLGVTIGIFLVITVSSFSEGIIVYVNEQVSLTAGLVTVLESDTPAFMIPYSTIEEDFVEEIQSISGVEKVAKVLYSNTDDAGRVIGVSPDSEEIIRGAKIELDEGRDFEEGQYEVVLGSKKADSLDVVLGDSIKIAGKDFEIVGILEETGKDQLDNSIMTDLSILQDITGNKGVITMIIVQPSTPEDADRIEQEINDNFSDLHASTDKSLMNSVGETLSQLNLMTFALGSIAALISGIVIMNVMMMAVRERRREIGTMKAVGATNKQILLSILFESISISAVGAVIGIALSFCGVALLNTILFRPIALVTLRLIAEGFLFAVAIGAVSGILPARQAARLNPIEALRYE